MTYLVIHEPTDRIYLAPSVVFKFFGNVDNGGVVASSFRPVGGVDVRWLHEKPENIRSAYRAMVNESGRGFRPECRVPGKAYWYSTEIVE